jgi:hypothetical protein
MINLDRNCSSEVISTISRLSPVLVDDTLLELLQSFVKATAIQSNRKKSEMNAHMFGPS